MKTTIKNSVVVMAMLGAITGYANLRPSDVLNETIEKTIIKLDNVKEGQRLLIKSKTGTIVYRESIQKTGLYKKEFDLTSLPNGDYFFELDKDFEITIIPFNVKDAQVIFKKEEEKTIFKPVIRTENNILFVGKLALNMEPMKIEIFFDSGDYELIDSKGKSYGEGESRVREYIALGDDLVFINFINNDSKLFKEEEEIGQDYTNIKNLTSTRDGFIYTGKRKTDGRH